MKGFMYGVLVAATIMIAGVSKARAEVVEGIRFTTTFPFTVGTRTVPPGTYFLQPVEDNLLVLQLRDVNGGLGVFFPVNETTMHTAPKQTEVVFQRFPDGLVLKDVFVAGDAVGDEAVLTRAERQAEKSHEVASVEHVPATRLGVAR